MTTLSLRAFNGEFPRTPPYLLPDNAAQAAINCDFSEEQLQSLNGNSPLTTLANVIQGLYTEDGINFLSWVDDTNAVRGPVLEDSHLRLYYTTTTDFRVTQRTQATPSGGPPASSWKVGVPYSTVAPTASVGNAPTLPDGIVLAWKFFYEANGQRYQEQTITPTTVTVGREYTFVAPLIQILDRATDNIPPPDVDTIVSQVGEAYKATPDNAIPCIEVTGTLPTGTQAFKAYSSNSNFAQNNETENFNGLTVSLSVVNDGGVTSIKFDYGKGFQQTRAFVYTVVNIFSEESAPSLPLLVTYDIMQVPTLTLPAVSPTGYLPFSAFRVYGSVSASTGQTDYQLIGEVSTDGTLKTFDVVTKPALWTTLLGTIGHLPPSSSLRNLMLLPTGILAAIKGNEVWFSEAYKGWAWNPENVITLPFGIIGAVLSASGIVVTTTVKPYIIYGRLPESMQEEPILLAQAGITKNGMCDAGELGVFYLCNDGIANVRGGQGTISMGQRFFTRKKWRARYSPSVLATMRLAYFDGCLIAYSLTAGAAFIIRFDEATGSMSQLNGMAFAAGFILPQTDSLYLASGTTLTQFAAGTPLSFQWTTKDFILPTPQTFGCIQVKGTGSLSVDVFAEDAYVTTLTFTDSQVQRLPDGFKVTKLRLVLNGSGVVKELHVAPTIKALKNV